MKHIIQLKKKLHIKISAYLEVDDGLRRIWRQRDGGDASNEVAQLDALLDFGVARDRPQEWVHEGARDVALKLILL